MVYFEDVEVGDTFYGEEVVAEENEMVEYGRRFDRWPMHSDPNIGDLSPLGGLVASGGYSISLWYKSAHSFLSAPGNEWAFMGGFDWHVQFPLPLRPGDRVRNRIVITDKRLSSKPGRGIANNQADLINENDDEVLRITVAYLMATRPTVGI